MAGGDGDLRVPSLKVKAEVMEVSQVDLGKFIVRQNSQRQDRYYLLFAHKPLLIYFNLLYSRNSSLRFS